jgi:hypothetical protein
LDIERQGSAIAPPDRERQRAHGPVLTGPEAPRSVSRTMSLLTA